MDRFKFNLGKFEKEFEKKFEKQFAKKIAKLTDKLERLEGIDLEDKMELQKRVDDKLKEVYTQMGRVKHYEDLEDYRDAIEEFEDELEEVEDEIVDIEEEIAEQAAELREELEVEFEELRDELEDLIDVDIELEHLDEIDDIMVKYHMRKKDKTGFNYGVLPFLSDEDLNKTVELIVNGELKNVRIAPFAPFISSDALDQIVDAYLAGTIEEKLDLVSLLPFMKSETLYKVSSEIAKGDVEGIDINAVMPFLKKEDLSKIYANYLEKFKNSQE